MTEADEYTVFHRYAKDAFNMIAGAEEEPPAPLYRLISLCVQASLRRAREIDAEESVS